MKDSMAEITAASRREGGDRCNPRAPSSNVKRPQVQLKTPKGTRDWTEQDLSLRDTITQKLTAIFGQHGAAQLDTPVFETREILAGKYGEDSKLIYDLSDEQGSNTPCSLRYDLTVPFARWLATHNFTNVRRYQAGKVYRRDQPSLAKGRMREFTQCDFDVAGAYDPMIPDAEVICVVVEAFDALGLGAEVVVKVNHRRILDGMFDVAGVEASSFRAVSSAVDKLDKLPWGEVKREMVQEKGVADEVAERIGGFVRRQGSVEEMLEFLRGDAALAVNESVRAGLRDMELLGAYLAAMDVPAEKLCFDLSLARGLDYYTGLIFEAVFTQSSSQATDEQQGAATSRARSTLDALQVGSIAAGGRYDDLVGMFGKRSAPVVGVSFGVDRIFTVLDSRRGDSKRDPKAPPRAAVDVYVMAFADGRSGEGEGRTVFDGLLAERMTVARQLWNGGLRAEFAAKVKPRPSAQADAAKDVARLAVVIGAEEWAAGKVRLKILDTRLLGGNEEKGAEDLLGRGRLLERSELVEEAKTLLNSM